MPIQSRSHDSSGGGAVLLEIGRVDRPHGLRGEVIVTLITNVEGRLARRTEVLCDLGPLIVEWAQPHQHRWIVKFEGVDSREAADELRGIVIRAHAIEDPDDPDALWAHQVIGATVITQGGAEQGKVVALVDNPASDLLELESGALVPLNFVLGWDRDRRLVVDPPPGLLEDG